MPIKSENQNQNQKQQTITKQQRTGLRVCVKQSAWQRHWQWLSVQFQTFLLAVGRALCCVLCLTFSLGFLLGCCFFTSHSLLVTFRSDFVVCCAAGTSVVGCAAATQSPRFCSSTFRHPARKSFALLSLLALYNFASSLPLHFCSLLSALCVAYA